MIELKIKRLPFDYRVSYIENGKLNLEKSYFTDDLEDALITRKAMQIEIDQNAGEYGFEVNRNSNNKSLSIMIDLPDKEITAQPDGDEININHCLVNLTIKQARELYDELHKALN